MTGSVTFRPRFPGLRQYTVADVQDPSVFRLYRARVSEHSIHIPGRHPEYGASIDRRMVVHLG